MVHNGICLFYSPSLLLIFPMLAVAQAYAIIFVDATPFLTSLIKPHITITAEVL